MIVNEDILKSLFIFRTGENKGFAELMQKQKLDKEYEDRFKEFIKSNIDGIVLDSVNELYVLCKNRKIDADVKVLVEQLYNFINGGADE